MPQSANECSVSASIAPEPLITAATPFATAITTLTASDLMISPVDSPALMVGAMYPEPPSGFQTDRAT